MPYCIECGSQLVQKKPVGDDQLRDCCPDCAYVHYDKYSLQVGVILHHKDKLLWIKRATEPYKGFWTFPAGFLEPNESLQHGAARELYEETGIQLRADQLRPFGLLSVLCINQLFVSFHCACERELEVTLTPEVSEWGWFGEDDAPWSEMAYPESSADAHQTYQWLRDGHFPLRIGHKQGDTLHQFIYGLDS